MRKIIIDTDTASDDAVAIITALREKSIKVLAITTVAGNVDVERATENALIAIEKAKTYAPPVYKGLSKPLIKEQVEAKDIHGKDGLGNTNFHPNKLKAEREHAVKAILRIIQENPYEIELVTLGPLTNIAYAYLLAPEIMRKLKSITLMVGNGIEGGGNITEFAEFNAYADPDALKIVMEIDVPQVILGWDVAIGDGIITYDEINALKKLDSNTVKFVLDICKEICTVCKLKGKKGVGFADPLVIAVFTHPNLVKKSIDTNLEVITNKGEKEGQVILSNIKKINKSTETVIVNVDGASIKKYLLSKLIDE